MRIRHNPKWKQVLFTSFRLYAHINVCKSQQIFSQLRRYSSPESISSTPKSPRHSGLEKDAANLKMIIAENYDSTFKTLHLSKALKNKNLLSVLYAIRDSPCYEEVEGLILTLNDFDHALDTEVIRLLPPNLITLDMSGNRLFGSNIPWHVFPSKLQILYLQNNNLEGQVDWSLLPRELLTLSIHHNKFDGIIEWSQLPNSLRVLYTTTGIADASIKSVPKNWNGGFDYYSEALFLKDTTLKVE